MVETLHPDVYTVERGGEPTIVGVSTTTIGFIGTAKRGPLAELGFCSSFRDFERKYGSGWVDGYLEDSVWLAFTNGASRIYIGRMAGAGAAKAVGTLRSLSGAPTAAVIDGSNAAPFNIEPAATIVLSVDGGGGQTFTFNATRSVRPAGGAPGGTPGAGQTLLVTIDGGGQQTITFAGTESTAALIAAAINAQLLDGFADVSGGVVRIASDSRGTGSSVNIDAGSTGLVATAFTAGTTTGTGNVVNIDAVTIAEVLTITAASTGASFTSNAGKIRITHNTPGTGTIQITSAHAAFGLPGGSVAGTTNAPVPMLQVRAKNEGAWGDELAATSERWRATTTALIGAVSTTSAVLNDVSKVEIGDIVEIDDGTTRLLVHVRTVTVSTKTITFKAVTPGAPIAAGTLVRSASSHRAKTTLALAGVSADTIITVVSTTQLRVGTRLSIDDGTTLIFRKVTKVNGKQLTLDSALGANFASGTLVVTQHFDISVYLGGTFRQTHRFLSLEPEDTQDYVEVRLGILSNESDDISVLDLEPVISTPIQDSMGSSLLAVLSGGDNGATPDDNDYIGTSTPPTGLQLFGTLNPGDVNIIAIPGVGTTAVQQALADFAATPTNSVGEKVFALCEGPLSMDEPLEIKDWRLNVHNRDTSYAGLYYPWLEITDRNATVDAIRQVPPSGAVAGLIARTHSEVGVWEAPANRALIGVRGVVHNVTDGEWDLLNPIGINVIRSFPGEGIRVMGARTLTNTFDGRHYVNIRLLLTFDKISISRALRRFLFAGITLETFRAIERAIRSFHRNLWSQGGLFPSDDFSAAQFVKVDEENNPLASRKLGQLHVEAGINPPYPAEFIIFTIGLFDGETAISEGTQ